MIPPQFEYFAPETLEPSLLSKRFPYLKNTAPKPKCWLEAKASSR